MFYLLPTTHPSAVPRAEDRDAVHESLVVDLRVAARALSGARPAQPGQAPGRTT